ncbi:MAG: ABC transporter permease [bacterium]
MNYRRLYSLIRKELIQLLRDKRSLGIILFTPVLMLFLFGYAVSMDVNNVSTAILDQDKTQTSRIFVEHIMSSGYFTRTMDIDTPQQANDALDRGKAQVVLVIPRGFADDISQGRTAQLQTLIDGSESFTAGVVSGYLNQVVREFSAGIITKRLERFAGAARLPSLDPRVRAWYNPDLKSVNYMVPGVMCDLLLLVTIMLTAFAIVREKELGTLEQLVVTPITSLELILGKTVPFFIVAYIDLTLVLVFGINLFHVPVAGSILFIYLASSVFILCGLGLGLFISTVSQTQQEAMLSAFFIFLPSIILGGFIFPIENMPPVIQWFTYLLPLRYYLEIMRGIILKGNDITILWPQVLSLAVFAVLIIGISVTRFKKRLG